MPKIRTNPNPLRRALWRFDNLCTRKPWVPFVGIVVGMFLVMIIEGVAP